MGLLSDKAPRDSSKTFKMSIMGEIDTSLERNRQIKSYGDVLLCDLLPACCAVQGKLIPIFLSHGVIRSSARNELCNSSFLYSWLFFLHYILLASFLHTID